MSERFCLPDEALPSEPPPPTASLDGHDETPALGNATAHIPIPEKIRLLNAALPTPQSFEPVALVIPKATPVPHIDEDLPGEEAEGADALPLARPGQPLAAPAGAQTLAAPAASTAPPARRDGRSPAGRQIANAIALFLFLVSVSAVAILVCADFLFQ